MVETFLSAVVAYVSGSKKEPAKRVWWVKVAINLLLDLKVFVGRVLVAVDLHVGHVSLFRSGSDSACLLHLEYAFL